MSAGGIIVINYNNKNYKLNVKETKPANANAVSEGRVMPVN